MGLGVGAWINTSSSVSGGVDFSGSEGIPTEEFREGEKAAALNGVAVREIVYKR